MGPAVVSCAPRLLSGGAHRLAWFVVPGAPGAPDLGVVLAGVGGAAHENDLESPKDLESS